MAKKKVIIGSDHGGFKFKEAIKEFLVKNGYSIEDRGTFSEESCDYPDFAKQVAEKVAQDKNVFGVLVCGTGIGMSMAANKVKGIRAALCHNEFTAKMAREHNNANILCMGGRVLDEKTALKIVKIFLATEFAGLKPEGERHKRRVEKINRIEAER